MRKTKHLALWSIGLFAFVVVASCGKKQDAKIDLGTIEGSIYKNKYFGFSLKIPEKWQVQDNETKKMIMERGKKLAAGNEGSLKELIDASELHTVNLLTMFQHPLGTPVDYNPAFVIVAERISHLPGITSGRDYFFHAKQLMERAQIKYTFAKDTYSESISRLSFHVMEVEMKTASLLVKQKYYVTIMKGYALLFITSYTTDEEWKRQDEVIKSIKFS